MTSPARWPHDTPDRIRRRAVERTLAHRLEAALARPAAQQPEWPDPEAAAAVTGRLTAGEPLVTPAETRRLLDRLGAVARGEAFLMQSGDCAETFTDTEPHLRANLALLRRMALVLTHTAGLPVVTVARAAGQYAKPRSAAFDADGLPVYRGDIINSARPDGAARTPDPERMAHARRHARQSMSALRRLAHDDLADTLALHEENRHFVHTAPGGRRHAARFARIDHELRRNTTADSARGPRIGEIWTSHEALLLDYERTLLWIDPEGPEPLLSSGLAHFLWIGERTRRPDGAHLAFAALLANPVGVKIGPGTTPEQAVEYVRRLDPHGVPGRLTLIIRMGHDRVRELLPPIVEKVTASGRQVIWQCDPMHGNTRTTDTGYKTRRYEHVLDEITGFLQVHRALGTHPAGLHLEATGDDVTECTGGARGLREQDLPARYRTACDPRLNAEQSMELAFAAAELFAAETARSTEVPR